MAPDQRLLNRMPDKCLNRAIVRVCDLVRVGRIGLKAVVEAFHETVCRCLVASQIIRLRHPANIPRFQLHVLPVANAPPPVSFGINVCDAFGVPDKAALRAIRKRSTIPDFNQAIIRTRDEYVGTAAIRKANGIDIILMGDDSLRKLASHNVHHVDALVARSGNNLTTVGSKTETPKAKSSHMVAIKLQRCVCGLLVEPSNINCRGDRRISKIGAPFIGVRQGPKKRKGREGRGGKERKRGGIRWEAGQGVGLRTFKPITDTYHCPGIACKERPRWKEPP